MSHEVSQWLAEIQTLRQQLVQAQEEREAAFASAANWQRLYETEAQQRRTDARLSRQTIEELKLEIQQLQGYSFDNHDPASYQVAVESTVASLHTVEELREKLVEVLLECDRLQQALKTEQDNHIQTRKSLTTALGDAIGMLSKEKANQTAMSEDMV